jgi:hypothetical protein
MVQSPKNHLVLHQIKKQLGNEEVALRNKSKISPMVVLGIIMCMTLAVPAVGGMTSEESLTFCTTQQKTFNESEVISYGPGVNAPANDSTGVMDILNNGAGAADRRKRYKGVVLLRDGMMAACKKLQPSHYWGYSDWTRCRQWKDLGVCIDRY